MEHRLSIREALRTAGLLLLALALAIWGQRVLVDRSMPLDGPFFYALAIALFLWTVARTPDWLLPGAPALPSEPGGGGEGILREREQAETGAEQVALPEEESDSAGIQGEEATGAAEVASEGKGEGARVAGWMQNVLGVESTPLAITALILGVATFLLSGNNRFTVLNVGLWLATLVAFVAAFAELPTRSQVTALPRRVLRSAWSIRLNWTTVALLVVILVAIFFRFYQLDHIPAEMTSDHAEKLLDVNDVLNGQFRIFFPRNTGREAFQFYLTALLIRLFDLPVGHLALKLGTALFGVMAIPFTYLLARELFDEQVGLLAAALLAISQWHVAITRVGLRFPFTAAFAAPALYFLVRAFKYNRRNDWLLCGLFLGIGLHAYTSLRVLPLLLAFLVGIKLVFDLLVRVTRSRAGIPAGADAAAPEKSSLRVGFWANAFLAAMMALIVFLPLGRYMVDNPQIFWYRVLTRSSDLETPVVRNTGAIFLDNLKNALLMFNLRGDVVWVNTVPGSPVLDTITGALFVLGMAYVLWRLVRHGDRRSAYLLAALFMLLLPSVLSLAFPGENPSVVRAGGAVVIVMVIAGLPLALVARSVCAALTSMGLAGTQDSAGSREDASPAHHVPAFLAGGLVVLLLIAAARLNYDWYFRTYDEQYRQSSWNTTEMGRVVQAFAGSVGDMQHAYHVAYAYWADTRNIGINAGDPTWSNAILDIEQVRSLAGDAAAKLFLVKPEDERSIAVLKETFPNGDLRYYKSRTPNKDFLIFFAPKR